MRNVNEEWRQKSSESEDKAADFPAGPNLTSQLAEGAGGTGERPDKEWKMEGRKEGGRVETERDRSLGEAQRAFWHDKNISSCYSERN